MRFELLYINLARADCLGGAGHIYVAAVRPVYFELAAAQDDFYILAAFAVAVEYARDCRRACARSAGERFARAALPYAHFYARVRNNLNELGVYSVREGRK